MRRDDARHALARVFVLARAKAREIRVRALSFACARKEGYKGLVPALPMNHGQKTNLSEGSAMPKKPLKTA